MMPVAPHAGAWIETLSKEIAAVEEKTSRPMRARGLKPVLTVLQLCFMECRAPCGRVD